jgi:predicted dehydrogenase
MRPILGQGLGPELSAGGGDPIGAAVVGLGYWGPNLARNILVTKGMKLTGLCDLDQALLEAPAELCPGAFATTRIEELLGRSDVDAVLIATPVGTHFELAKQALLAGKHVLVEKPLAANSKQAEELVAIAEERRLVLMVDHIFLYSPAVQKLAQLHHAGELGKLQFIDSVRINLGLIQQDVNVIWDLAPHDISIIDHIVGRGPQSVRAVAPPSHYAGITTIAYLHLDYGDDLMASVHVNWQSPVKIRHFLVGGTRRSALYDNLDQSEPLKLYDRGVDVDESPEDRRRILISYRSGDVWSPRIDKVEPLQNVLAEFSSCIREGRTPLSGGRSGLELVRVLEAADRSLAENSASIEVDGA